MPAIDAAHLLDATLREARRGADLLARLLDAVSGASLAPDSLQEAAEAVDVIRLQARHLALEARTEAGRAARHGAAFARAASEIDALADRCDAVAQLFRCEARARQSGAKLARRTSWMPPVPTLPSTSS